MRLEFGGANRLTLVVSRSNLLALLAKLDGHPPDSECTLIGGTEAGGMALRAEEDDVHYARRDRGLMHDDTEDQMTRERRIP